MDLQGAAVADAECVDVWLEGEGRGAKRKMMIRRARPVARCRRHRLPLLPPLLPPPAPVRC